jgi:peptide/nickel transport system permease protein
MRIRILHGILHLEQRIMGKFLLKRLLISIPTFLVITMMIFTLVNITPGDPLLQMMDPEVMRGMSEEDYAVKRAEMGLDKPIPARYWLWFNEVLKGNWGYSYNTRRPVLDVVLEKIPNTLTLMGSAFLVAILVGIPVGILSAVKQYSILDYTVTAFSFFMMAMPVFFFAMLLIYFLSLKLHLFPTGGMSTLGIEKNFFDSLRHLILPAMMLGLKDAGMWARYTRSSMLEVLNCDYIFTGRSKGFREPYILRRHAFPNATSSLITVFGLMLPNVIAGAVITENVFAWPGIGKLAVESIKQRDYPVLMGITSIIALTVLFSNLLADILYSVADPRIRLDK